MGYLSRRRGVISVFLLIIYVITYVFMGALVDAGRYRIAQTYAEAALDNASTSVLANYNKLVYDLYGLFSVDLGATSEEELTSKIKSSYEQYLNESLGLANVNKDEYTTKLNKLLGDVMDSFNEEDQPDGAAAKKTFSIGTDALYDFQITELNVGTTITLADTANVENQIIEHMKYRAPVELVQEMGGFLNGLKELVGMGKQIGAITEKMKITSKSEYTSLPQTAAAIPGEVAAYAEKVKSFATTNDESLLKMLPDYFDMTIGYAYGSRVEYEDSYKNVYLDECDAAVTYCSATNRNALEDAVYEATKDVAEEGASEEEIEAVEEFNAEWWDEICGLTIEELMDEAYYIISENSDVKAALKAEVREVVERIEEERRGKLDEAKDAYATGIVFAPGTENTASYFYNQMETKAYNLAVEGEALLNKISGVIEKYEAYIGELEALEEKNKDDATVTGVCDADVQIAKSSAGSMLEYVNYLSKTISALNQIYNDNTLSDLIKEAEINVAEKEAEAFLRDVYPGLEYTLNYAIFKDDDYNGTETEIENVIELTSFLSGESKELTEDYNKESKTDSGETKKTKAEKITETKPETSEKEPDGEVEKEDKKIDTTLMIENPDLLDVDFMSTTSNLDGVKNMDTSLAVDDEKVDAAWVTKLLEMGNTIVQGISDMLNGARDNLYINCYIMDMFPNYYMHYSKAEDNKDDKLLSEERSKYNASLAEVEFIITGAGLSEEEFYKSLAEEEEKGAFAKFFDWLLGKEDEEKEIDGIGELSVKEFRSKLFGTRMLFNTISMFLDTSKYTQATTISAWAGPLAPVVAIVLMVAWAVAETVIDVGVLMGEEMLDNEKNSDDEVAKVPLLKLSAEQWFLSLENVISELAGTAIGAAAEGIISAADTLKTSMLNKADEAMFDMYEKAKEAAENGITVTSEECQKVVVDTLGVWMEEMTSGVTDMDGVTAEAKKYAEDIADGVNSAITSGIDTAEAEAKQLADKGIDAAYNGISGKVMETLTTVGDKVTDSIESTVNNAADSAKKFINDKIDKVLPEMVGTGKSKGCEFAMGYTDYLMFFLLTMDGDVKIKRVMALIQANITNGMNEEYESGDELTDKFQLANCPVSVWADLELSMKYMFMSDQLVPGSMKKNGRMRLKVISAQSY